MFGYDNPIVQNDLKEIVATPLPWDLLAHKTVLVTGVNGMLATYVAYALLYLVKEKGMDITILALTRSIDKTRELYRPFVDKPYFKILHQDIVEPVTYTGEVDYVFSLAGNASPRFINTDPVGIVKANLLGTFNLMELARQKKSRILLASTREVYGAVDAELLREDSFGSLDPMENRSCYPESKRAMETIARSYFLQYGVESIAVRIAHSYGPGMKTKGDGRVMADFIGDAIEGRDIVLHSSGEAERAFLYVSDAVVGMFTLLFKGEAGQAYNLSNETEPYPIYQVAQKICSLCKEKDIKVVFANEKPQAGYCKYPRVALDNAKIKQLGFDYNITLEEGLKRTIQSFN